MPILPINTGFLIACNKVYYALVRLEKPRKSGILCSLVQSRFVCETHKKVTNQSRQHVYGLEHCRQLDVRVHSLLNVTL